MGALALCLTAAVRVTLAIFCRRASKTQCCRLNQLKSRVNSHTVPHYACIKFDHIRHLNFDLSRSHKVKCDGGLDTPYMISYIVLNSNI